VVEGYTDVLMAHQLGVSNVVATLGTALNARHVKQLQRFVGRVVLVFDADAGGDTGVDRALGIFLSQDVDLAIASLPEGYDPCDLLLQRGAEAFRSALGSAVDALEFKIDQILSQRNTESIEGKRRAVDSLLGMLALAPWQTGETGAIKRQLVVTRIAHRFSLSEESLWGRLAEIREGSRSRSQAGGPGAGGPNTGAREEPPAQGSPAGRSMKAS